ncbi:MAG TPA: RNA polymerase sigma factor [Thermoanaerobaculia bacterium]|nr:RNA polymerase sigma factor [Thermoanaerobaculia bacterium]
MDKPDETFERIFATYYRPVFRFFLHRGFSQDEAQDLVQEVFLRVFRRLDGIRNESLIGTWVFSIATNLWRNEIRLRQTEKRGARSVSLDEFPDGTDQGYDVRGVEEDPNQALIAAEKKKLLLKALAELPPQMRRCVRFRTEQGLKYREIAEILQISIDTVKSHLNTAKSRLTARLGSELPRVS